MSWAHRVVERLEVQRDLRSKDRLKSFSKCFGRVPRDSARDARDFEELLAACRIVLVTRERGRVFAMVLCVGFESTTDLDDGVEERGRLRIAWNLRAALFGASSKPVRAARQGSA